MLFDTHAHPYMNSRKSSEVILENFFRTSSNLLLSIGCDRESSQKSIDLANMYPRLKATIGFHPVDTPLFESIESAISSLESLYEKNKKNIVAIGEIGLDYYWLADISKKSGLSQHKIQEIQARYFRAQIALAKKLKLPFIIHSRESNEEVLEILQQEKAENYVLHCFSGDWIFAQKVLQQNPQAMFGFGGILTFKKSLELQEVAQKLPLENIFIETDAPFLTPEPFRGKEENEPLYASYVLQKLQDLRRESPQEVEREIFKNSTAFFGLEKDTLI